MAVIRATVAVLTRRAAELRQGDERHVLHPISQVAIESRQTFSQIFEAVRHLTFGTALIHVGIPALDFCKSDLQADVGFDETGDLREAGAEAPSGIALSRRRNL